MSAIERGEAAQGAVRGTPGGRWLHRARLLDLLESSTASGLALVVAPLGTGKTTLLQQFAAGRADDVVWLGQSQHHVDELARRPLRGATVVVDDAHRLSRRAVFALSRQIERATPQTTFVVAARSLPPFNLAHCEFPVPVLVTEEDLRFRTAEIGALFGRVYDAPISKAVARDLARATDGWAAALYLQHLSERSAPVRPARAAVGTPREALLLDRALTWEYLTREVLAPLPLPLVHFLRVTCVLDPVSVPACDLLLDWEGSRAALHELTSRSGLVRPDRLHDDVFSYHPVLRAHLTARLAEAVGTARALELHERARQVRQLLSGRCEQPVPRGPTERRTPPGRSGGWPAAGGVPVEVRCLGGFELRVGGVEVDLSTVRPTACTMLRILAVHAGSPVHREVLVESFWPDHSFESGIHNLHVTVSSLRQRLEEAAPGSGRALLARSGDAYVFAPGQDGVTDLQRLEREIQAAVAAAAADDQAGRRAALRRALELHTGELLPAEGPAEWVVEMREQIRQRVGRVAVELAGAELALGDVAAAVAAAARSVELDPWNDEAWRRLIACHVVAGDHAQAARARRAYARRLRDLGVEAPEVAEAPARGIRSS